MNKWFIRLASLLMVIGLLVGCASNTDDQNNTNNNQIEQNQNNDNSSEVAEEAVAITISQNHNEEVISEEEVIIKEGAILLDILKENFDIEEEGGLISSIEGIEQDEDQGKYWFYSVNGEEAPVGAGEYELSVGDKVNFDLHAWE